jgi:hypothetical protein
MDPGDLTPFGLSVEFLDDGRALLRIGATLIALSPRQVQELRQQLGVGTVSVVNETPFAIRWDLQSAATARPGGKNYTLTLRTGPHDPAPAFAPENLPSNVKRLPKPRKKKEKP